MVARRIYKLEETVSLKPNLLIWGFMAIVMLMAPLNLTEASNSIAIKSQLEIATFWSDFVFIKWYFRANLNEPNLNMTMLIPGDVLKENFSSGTIFNIDKELDPLTNYTTFSLESPLPLGTISDDFPNDRYEANYFIGCNFLSPNHLIDLGGVIPGPTDNYQASWELRTDPTFKDRVLTLPLFALNGLQDLTHWFRLHLSIFHRPVFQEYMEILVKQVPSTLKLFGVLLAILVFGFVFCDYATSRSLRSKRINLIELLIIPVSAAIIVFVPIYILALHAFETPLTIPKVEQSLIDVLYVYLIIALAGIFLRVISSKPDLQDKQ